MAQYMSTISLAPFYAFTNSPRADPQGLKDLFSGGHVFTLPCPMCRRSTVGVLIIDSTGHVRLLKVIRKNTPKPVTLWVPGVRPLSVGPLGEDTSRARLVPIDGEATMRCRSCHQPVTALRAIAYAFQTDPALRPWRERLIHAMSRRAAPARST